MNQRPKQPDKGSFPLDHLDECKQAVEAYRRCLRRHEGVPKLCRGQQQSYIECRMARGLMQPEDLQRLGFTADLDWRSEAEEKQALLRKLNELKEHAFRNVREDLLTRGQAESPPPARP